MKRLLLSFTLLFAVISANALSYNEARERALYLTDKMAYELNLTDEQYESVYQINLEYFLSINSVADIDGMYWTYRDEDLRCILWDTQYSLYCTLDYFFHPIRWYRSAWYYPIFSYYGRGIYFYSRPSFYYSYRGGLWRGRMRGGPSPFRGRHFDRGGRRLGDHYRSAHPGGGHHGTMDLGRGGRGGARPGGHGGMRPGRNSGARPGGNGGMRPGGNGGMRPGGNSGARPGGNGSARPGGNGGMRPEGNGSGRPSGSIGSNSGVRSGGDYNRGSISGRSNGTMSRPSSGLSSGRSNGSMSRPSSGLSSGRSNGSMSRPSSGFSGSRSSSSMSRSSGGYSGGRSGGSSMRSSSPSSRGGGGGGGFGGRGGRR